MNCDEFRDLLWNSDPADKTSEQAIFDHLARCEACTRTWNEPDPTLPASEHLTADQVGQLVRAERGSLGPAAAPAWRHAAACAACWDELSHARACLADAPEVETPGLAPGVIWQRWLAAKRAVALIWIGAALSVRAATRARGGVSRRSTGASPEQLPAIYRSFIGPYELSIEFLAADPEKKSFGMRMSLAGQPGDPVKGIVVTVSRGCERWHVVSFGEREIQIPAMGPGKYDITLARPDGEVLGELTVEAPESAEPEN